MNKETSQIIRYRFFCLDGDGRIFSLQTAYRWTVGPWHHVEMFHDNTHDGQHGDSVFFNWQRVEGDSVLYNNGFHGSRHLLPAFLSTPGTIVARVEVKDMLATKGDIEMWRSMRIAQAWHWNKEDSVRLAIVAAEFALPLTATTAAASEAAEAVYFATRAAEMMAPSGGREAFYEHISSWMKSHLAELVPYAETERS